MPGHVHLPGGNLPGEPGPATQHFVLNHDDCPLAGHLCIPRRSVGGLSVGDERTGAERVFRRQTEAGA
jgi:hypothetical protein